MNNKTNIYDIDGELIRAAGDNHEFTLEESKEKIKYYEDKLKELDEKDPKYSVYVNYIRNLNMYIFSLYNKMKPEEIQGLVNNAVHKTEEGVVEKTMRELAEEMHKEESLTQEDMMVERDTEAPVMEEIIEEV